MEKYCDLHTHSVFSDGTLTPEELVAAAEAAGLEGLALTDHNTVAGLPRFVAAGANSPVEVVPGVELSTDYQGQELHILALWLRPEHYAAVTELTRQMQLDKQRSNIALIDALRRDGYALSYERLKAAMPEGEPNRAHIAAELTRLGYTANNQEAFRTLLSPSCGYYQPPRRIETLEALAFIRSLGAVSVLAHPFLNLKEPEALRGFLSQAVDVGLCGMEVMYSKFTPEQTALAWEIAEQFRLLPSGGSDFHGKNKPDIALGTGRGDLRIPISCLRDLKGRIF